MAEELQQLREVECSISSVEKKLDAYAVSKQQVKRLRSALGVGPRLSEAVAKQVSTTREFGLPQATLAGMIGLFCERRRLTNSSTIDRLFRFGCVCRTVRPLRFVIRKC